jgi:hypothetical protein
MNSASRLVFENSQGKVVRTFATEALDLSSDQNLFVIQREQGRRLELVRDLNQLEENGIKFSEIAQINTTVLKSNGLNLKGLGQLRFVENIENLQKDQTLTAENQKKLWSGIWLSVVLFVIALSYFVAKPIENLKIEEELQQTIVQIAKSIPKQKLEYGSLNNMPKDMPKPQIIKSGGVKRMGALAALGSLSSSTQKSGLNLGAAQTTGGPGLGGTQGSGGVQTTIYAKGLTGAALGVGGNVQGAGGYGTKGKGGGQAGYGTMSLVGSAAGVSVPMNNEASVGGGLDRDMIAAVINRNMGQVRFCYEQGLQGQPNLNGRVALDFTIGSQGLVKGAQVASSTLEASAGSKMVEDCIVQRLKSWKFPVPEGGVDVKVSYPFVLRRAGQG